MEAIAHSERVSREREFHNQRFLGDSDSEHDARTDQLKYYWAIEEGAEAFRRRLKELATDRDILELGCGVGDTLVDTSLPCRSAVGLDISDVAVSVASSRARERGLMNHRFLAGDAHETGLQSGSVDLIFGCGIIHHLDIPRSLAECRRLLRPGGTILFWEPLGHNPLIQAYRAVTPSARTPDEHPLVRRDFSYVRRYFNDVSVSYFGLSTLGVVPFRRLPSAERVRAAAAKVDRAMFKIPGLRWTAWYSLIEAR